MPRPLLLALMFGAIASSVPVGAQTRPAGREGEVPRAASAVINTVMSPYCPGLLLANCPSPSADSLRRAIVARAARGATEAELRADLVGAYGEMVLAAPRMSGLGAVAWIAPFALLLGVGALVFRWLRAQRSTGALPTPADAASLVPLDPSDADRMRRLQEMVSRQG